KGFAHPEVEIGDEWRATSQAIRKARILHGAKRRKPHVLVINGSPRSEHTCPGEMSKSHRLSERALGYFKSQKITTEYLDLSRTTSEYGKMIHPCKACVSTAMPLCHWPCSCYPNYALGQVHDWMNEIYPMWVRAHAIMIITPVHWYGPPSALKLMMDRLVCADGGNPDYTSTKGKTATLAKEMELKGWNFPKHLGGRMFSVITHGDTEGALSVKLSICSWLKDSGLISAGNQAEIDRYIGYYEPYAISHDALDHADEIFKEVDNAACLLANSAQAILKNPKNLAITTEETAVRAK
ncbi:MAG: flavodoxin family protein, partial [Bdellovibrionales bacterium]|nr:flavodoxin family protein [Oligoflexia bacterium]